MQGFASIGLPSFKNLLSSRLNGYDPGVDTRYHERQKEKGHFQEKKAEASKSNPSHPQNYGSSNKKKKKNSQKRDKLHSSLLNKGFKLMGSEKERKNKEGLYAYCGGKHHLECCFKRTFSIPTSVHIPSLISHQALLSSRDEVFKEIHNVEEDNSVSSLHVFFGNMDLPPSTSHDSLEELWDEEEEAEIKTSMKFVHSAYHQYLYALFKVKAEKPPLHSTCDHHIELEGSPTAAKVIDSFSNQE
ncbi:hypothetical protein O181_081054 [Austropuccinia psidii MF-1]|uniref:Uncharacterized protein n=1 Tax=Austropuccinia psidii MF-1 TaxID=1389203 RepID=A0A9Q3FM36_9BASI|nr:hypothetical protein [Austropuccinia psidii MF-1]